MWESGLVSILDIITEKAVEGRLDRLENALLALIAGLPELAAVLLDPEADDDQSKERSG
jgi:hypothetical protein